MPYVIFDDDGNIFEHAFWKFNRDAIYVDDDIIYKNGKLCFKHELPTKVKQLLKAQDIVIKRNCLLEECDTLIAICSKEYKDVLKKYQQELIDLLDHPNFPWNGIDDPNIPWPILPKYL